MHWPFFAFANNLFLTPVPPALNAALLVLVAAAAELQYRFVEQRFRGLVVTRRTILILAAIPALLVGASLAALPPEGSAAMRAREGGAGLGEVCDTKADVPALAACATAAAPRTMLWGDSFAMALVPGLAPASPGGIVQATKSVCGPFLGLAPVDGAVYTRDWAQRCLRFNEAVLRHLAETPSIRLVVLSSALVQYVPGGEDHDWRTLAQTPGGLAERPQDPDALLAGLARTVAAIRGLGRRVVLVAPPPLGPLDLGRCLERRAEGKPVIGGEADCGYPVETYRRVRRPILDLLARARAQGVEVVDFERELCGTGRCLAVLEDHALYRDRDHLSADGVRLLARRMRWDALFAPDARP